MPAARKGRDVFAVAKGHGLCHAPFVLLAMRSGPWPRLVAALLALVFTGAPRIAAGLADLGHAGAHRCRCAAHGPSHDCSCPFCQAAQAGHRETDATSKVPPCHRKAATRPTPQRSLPAGVACVRGGCGDPQGPRAVSTGLEPFTLPHAAVRHGLALGDAPRWSPSAPAPVFRSPDVPPPRA